MSVDKEKLRSFAERLVSDHLGGDFDPVPAIGVTAADVLSLLAEIERLEAEKESLRKDAERLELCLEMESAELAWSDSDGREIQAEHERLKEENDAMRIYIETLGGDLSRFDK